MERNRAEQKLSGRFLKFLPLLRSALQLGTKDMDGHAESKNGADEDGAGGQVLRIADHGIGFPRDAVGQMLQRGIESFGDPDEGRGQADPEPFTSVHMEAAAGDHHAQGGKQMQSGVGLRANKNRHASESVPETLKTAKEVVEHAL